MSTGHERLAGLQQLRDGWLDGDGAAPDHGAIATARDLLDDIAATGRLPRPGIFPRISDTSIQFEGVLDKEHWKAVCHPDGAIVVEFYNPASDGLTELRASSPEQATQFLIDRIEMM